MPSHFLTRFVFHSVENVHKFFLAIAGSFSPFLFSTLLFCSHFGLPADPQTSRMKSGIEQNQSVVFSSLLFSHPLCLIAFLLASIRSFLCLLSVLLDSKVFVLWLSLSAKFAFWNERSLCLCLLLSSTRFLDFFRFFLFCFYFLYIFFSAPIS